MGDDEGTRGRRTRRGVRSVGGDSAEVLREVGGAASRGMSSSSRRMNSGATRIRGGPGTLARARAVRREGMRRRRIFFASTKFFSVLELELSRELFEASVEGDVAAQRGALQGRETTVRAGFTSSSRAR